MHIKKTLMLYSDEWKGLKHKTSLEKKCPNNVYELTTTRV